MNNSLNVGEELPGEATLILKLGCVQNHLKRLKTHKQFKPKPLGCLGTTPEFLNWCLGTLLRFRLIGLGCSLECRWFYCVAKAAKH